MKTILFFSFLLLTGAASAQPVKEVKPALQGVSAAQLPKAAIETEVTLPVLLGEGYEIIHVDAPVSEASARFILRKGNAIYSCLQRVYREGTGSGRSRGIPSVCDNLAAAS